MTESYASPPPAAPPVYTWYKVYCGAMAALYLLVAAMGAFLLVGSDVIADKADEVMGLQISGLVYLLLGLVFIVPYAVALFLPPRPWVWVYGIVMICIGMTSCCCLPAAIPLLIYWIKPDVKLFFGRPE